MMTLLSHSMKYKTIQGLVLLKEDLQNKTGTIPPEINVVLELMKQQDWISSFRKDEEILI